MISMYTKQEIIILSYREGKSHRQISRELQINRKTIKKYIDDFERHQSGSTQPETALSTYLSSPPLFRIGTRSKVHLTQEVQSFIAVSYTHLRAHETRHDLVCRLLLEKKKKNIRNNTYYI